MSAIWQLLSLLLYAFMILLVVRLILDYVRVFARDWRPRGALLVVAEMVFSATDPPLRMIRRVLPPLTVGGLRIDLAFIVLFLITSTLMGVLRAL